AVPPGPPHRASRNSRRRPGAPRRDEGRRPRPTSPWEPVIPCGAATIPARSWPSGRSTAPCPAPRPAAHAPSHGRSTPRSAASRTTAATGIGAPCGRRTRTATVNDAHCPRRSGGTVDPTRIPFPPTRPPTPPGPAATTRRSPPATRCPRHCVPLRSRRTRSSLAVGAPPRTDPLPVRRLSRAVTQSPHSPRSLVVSRLSAATYPRNTLHARGNSPTNRPAEWPSSRYAQWRASGRPRGPGTGSGVCRPHDGDRPAERVLADRSAAARTAVTAPDRALRRTAAGVRVAGGGRPPGAQSGAGDSGPADTSPPARGLAGPGECGHGGDSGVLDAAGPLRPRRPVAAGHSGRDPPGVADVDRAVPGGTSAVLTRRLLLPGAGKDRAAGDGSVRAGPRGGARRRRSTHDGRRPRVAGHARAVRPALPATRCAGDPP